MSALIDDCSDFLAPAAPVDIPAPRPHSPRRITEAEDTATLRSTLAFRHLKATLYAMSALCVTLWVCALSSILAGLARGKGFPLADKFPVFDDILIYRDLFRDFHTAAFFRLHITARLDPFPPTVFAYPPAAAPIYAAFYHFVHPDYVYVAVIALWTAFIAVASWRAVGRRIGSRGQTALWMGCFFLFSFPLVFLAQRANLELFVWILITFGVLLYRRGEKLSASAFFGLAAAVKLYPILLLGIFLTRKRDAKWAFFGASVAACATLAALWFAGPTVHIATIGFLHGVLEFKSAHAEVTRHLEAIFDHSLFSPLKLPALKGQIAPSHWAGTYYVVAGLGSLVLFLRVRTFPFLNRLTFLSTAMVLLPPVSYEYTLVHLYLPLLLIVLVLLHKRSALAQRGNASATVAVAAILSAALPLGIWGAGTFFYAGQVQVLALLVLMAASIAAPWGDAAETLIRQRPRQLREEAIVTNV